MNAIMITSGLIAAISTLAFVVELLVGEYLFLYPFERKTGFILRYGATVLICSVYRLAYAAYEPTIRDALQAAAGEAMGSSLTKLLLYVPILALTIIGMCFCFKGSWGAIVSACTAGYSVQHFAAKLYDIMEAIKFMDGLEERTTNLLFYWALPLAMQGLCFAFVCVLAYYFFAKPAEKHNYKNCADPTLNLLSIMIVLIGMGINRFAIDFSGADFMRVLANSLYAMTCCAFALIIQFSLYEREHSRMELKLRQTMLREQAIQYEQWKASLESAAVKYHDLRHELNLLKASLGENAPDNLNTLAQLIDSSFVPVHTGNEMLDVLLSSKKDDFLRRRITFTYIADGSVLKQEHSIALFSMFCNALDNAIASVSQIEDEERRIIDLSIRRLGEYAEIRIQNYFEGAIEFLDGLPVSTAEGEEHGYGMKSMKRTAESLGGTMSVSVEDGLFRLFFLLPISTE